MRFSMNAFIISLALTFSSLSFADWTLQQPSSIHFLTSKNTHITEIHRFKKFEGAINNQGLAKLSIDLASVDTRIAIRDERMQEHLFETSLFSQATFEANIPTNLLAQVSSGHQTKFELKGKISLHGEQAEAYCQVMISHNTDKTITVSSITPMVIKAESFNLIAGINKLQQLAGLKSITHTVPLTFNLSFKAD
ncbi:MAG: polyisoprenoid-binding protein YceI [Oleispira sp.]|jgi:polyisoprenoid-binding protein YceI